MLLSNFAYVTFGIKTYSNSLPDENTQIIYKYKNSLYNANSTLLTYKRNDDGTWNLKEEINQSKSGGVIKSANIRNIENGKNVKSAKTLVKDGVELINIYTPDNENVPKLTMEVEYYSRGLYCLKSCETSHFKVDFTDKTCTYWDEENNSIIKYPYEQIYQTP